MDNRLKKISRLLGEYSKGNFNKVITLSGKLDGLDAIISGINMLGEELKAATISKNYFNNIFNAVSDMVFVLDSKGKIEELNKSVTDKLGYNKNELIGKAVSFLQARDKRSFNNNFLSSVKENRKEIEAETYFQTIRKNDIPVRATFSVLKDDAKRRIQILLTVKDITSQIQQENAIIRAIVDTQETERGRLAKDLHDGLGQPLSAIKFYISSLAESAKNKERKLNLLKSNKVMKQMIVEIRNICFNLLPATLEDFGLIPTVMELCHQPVYAGKVNFKVESDPLFPSLQKEMAMDIFRIIQEFITNAIVHGDANSILIRFRAISNKIIITLQDNGVGFDVSKTNYQGRGLRNVHSRIKSHNGEAVITSIRGKGTIYNINIPINH